MSKCATAVFAVAALIMLIPAAARADLAIYTQDFESMTQTDAGALAGGGWLVFANVFAPGGAYLYGYGSFPAPNGGPPFAFCTISAGEGGAGQGAQQLVVFSDYNNGDHANGNIIESNVFHEMVVGAGSVGQTWVFQFDAKHGDLGGASTALAFIKTLNPAAGWATTNFITANMTAIPAAWSTYSLSIAIDASLVGQVLQLGFANNATHYEPSGTFYDNIQFAPEGTIPTESVTWGSVKSLYN